MSPHRIRSLSVSWRKERLWLTTASKQSVGRLYRKIKESKSCFFPSINNLEGVRIFHPYFRFEKRLKNQFAEFQMELWMKKIWWLIRVVFNYYKTQAMLNIKRSKGKTSTYGLPNVLPLGTSFGLRLKPDFEPAGGFGGRLLH